VLGRELATMAMVVGDDDDQSWAKTVLERTGDRDEVLVSKGTGAVHLSST
jgi:hypothetical protein